jgi:hypothetical protein
MNVGEIQKAYPKVTFKVGGYTDNTGVKWKWRPCTNAPGIDPVNVR